MPLLSLALFLFHESGLDSPFIVPVAGCLMILGIVIAGVWSSNRANEMRSRERLECIARGVTPPPTAEELAIMHGKPTADRVRRRANIRLSGIVVLSAGVGLVAFFIALSAILQQREVLSGAAVGLVPLAIGLGFLIDTRLQSKEMSESNSSSSSSDVA
ncbi:hypothetical protein SAMN05421819_3754 [Bryocella elongata]|uniref:DUF6249 domain-containing protein n=1 Tax=Bryocella elongata TaxID=863522 RepID=A0A1H6BK46_9BACT|nr:DUF6249 domain-containing protein [Bryocella elongata]SEG60805.1 hypothetical protein SAMN05421819_3754 [Bryocella elongata]